ncbi:MAG: hypothetical protein QNK04_06350 [Myxococcota bacterium]|nr:hypothetical protein [Myxococcota bacterium]
MSFGPRLRLLSATIPILLALALGAAIAEARLPDAGELRSWIEEFKASPRGPFERIRWFCKDGSVLAPKAYACRNHGGGIQHGEWNQRARDLRSGGYTVANVLASVDPEAFAGTDADLFALRQILLERFLIGWDDGWIFRGARTYRGALQIEDEEAGSEAMVRAMLGDSAWLEPERFLLLRETVRLLPLQADEAAAAEVRRQALVLAGKDPAFTPLRAKIHNQPDARDAENVRAFAGNRGKAALRSEYERLAAGIDALYSGSASDDMALALAPQVASLPELPGALRELGRKLEAERDPAMRVALAARLMGLLRKHLPAIRDPGVATRALQLSLVLETDGTVAGARAVQGVASESRDRRLELLDQTAEALYGAGLLSAGQLADIKKGRRRKDLGVLRKPPAWAGQALDAEFQRAIDHLAPLEPEVRRFGDDRVQVSLVPFYRSVIETLR